MRKRLSACRQWAASMKGPLMAGSARLLFLCWAACATAPTALPSNEGDAPEISDMRAHFPEFYKTAHARLMQEFHGADVAQQSQLGAGHWRVVLRIDLDVLGDNHGCRVLRSSGFNALDDEALAACRRV